MNIRIYSLIGLAVFALTSCTSNRNHCIAKIDPFDLSEENLNRTCNISVLPTKTNSSLIFSDNQAFQDSLSSIVTEKAIDTLNETNRFSVIYPDEVDSAEHPEVKADYVLVSNIDEFVLTEHKDDSKNRSNLQQEITASITYKLLSAKNSAVVFANTIKVGYFNKIYDPSLLNEGMAGTTETARNVLDDVNRLFKYNFINELNPVRVVDVNNDGVAILNQPLSIGSMCYVYYPGKQFKSRIEDETTGNKNIQGVLKVLDVTPTATFANITQGQVNKKDICRQLFFSEKFGWEPVYY